MCEEDESVFAFTFDDEENMVEYEEPWASVDFASEEEFERFRQIYEFVAGEDFETFKKIHELGRKALKKESKSE